MAEVNLAQTIRKLKFEHGMASIALNAAARNGSRAEFNIALDYKLYVIDELCSALKKQEEGQ